MPLLLGEIIITGLVAAEVQLILWLASANESKREKRDVASLATGRRVPFGVTAEPPNRWFLTGKIIKK